jgi:hypothetical protein
LLAGASHVELSAADDHPSMLDPLLALGNIWLYKRPWLGGDH